MPACPHCSRVNPAGAVFCYHDGSPMGTVPTGVGEAVRFRFAAPFIFPSGRACWTFDELALACADDWPCAVELLRDGALAVFLGGIGRHDLAVVAREAARFPDPDRALDLFLNDLPSRSLQPAHLRVTPDEIALGRLRVGANVRHELHIVNEGVALLHGTLSSDVPWLVVGEGEGEGYSRKLFSCLNETTISVQVRGMALRASLQSQIGRLTIESSGGAATISVTAEVPPQTFAAGVLAGARTPRQLAEKARQSPREAARLFETGAVARWYQDNGWTYPIEDESAAGLASVQQFFDALGLSKTPILKLSETSVSLTGKAGEQVLHEVRLSTSEKRPVYARAVSDQPWLIVTSVDLEGSSANVRLSVPVVPDCPGRVLRANLLVTGNSRQRFHVPISLLVTASTRRTAVPSSASAAGAAGAASTLSGGGSLDWLPFSTEPPPSMQETDSTVQDWLSGQTMGSSLPSLPSPPSLPPQPTIAADNPEAPTLTPVRHGDGERQGSIPRAVWLALLPIALLLLIGIAEIMIVVNLGSRPSPRPTTTKEEKKEQGNEASAPVIRKQAKKFAVEY